MLQQSPMLVRSPFLYTSGMLTARDRSAGGIGVIGGVRLNPKMLQKSIDEVKAHLEDKNAPFGVDLLIPQVGGNARKTNVSSLVLSPRLRRVELAHRLLSFHACSTTTRKACFPNLPMSSSRARSHFSYAPLASPRRRWWTSSTLLGFPS